MIELSKLEDRKASLEKQFSVLDKERETLIEQNRGIQQRLSEIQAEQFRLQGSYREIESLMAEETKPEIVQ